MDYEGWTFFEGCYFGFITLSTIGFGDFVPTTPRQGFEGASHAHVVLFIFLTAIYITLGLSVVSSVLVSMSRLLESKTDWTLVSMSDCDDGDDVTVTDADRCRCDNFDRVIHSGYRNDGVDGVVARADNAEG